MEAMVLTRWPLYSAAAPERRAAGRTYFSPDSPSAAALAAASSAAFTAASSSAEPASPAGAASAPSAAAAPLAFFGGTPGVGRWTSRSPSGLERLTVPGIATALWATGAGHSFAGVFGLA